MISYNSSRPYYSLIRRGLPSSHEERRLTGQSTIRVGRDKIIMIEAYTLHYSLNIPLLIVKNTIITPLSNPPNNSCKKEYFTTVELGF
ncbi:hypothetical protein JHK82_043956 [Glycine max]|uniref:Uncharacterized protein n=1 Tax=Glycine max TaxID=3847 RepID=A0A0R0GIC1_SOYBN|nr:hypothetical protein JHK87_043755 [Glycine soja]KAG4950603.1 hypothetical protein JHK86_043842 [Glycine max]KAG4958131.1 hypothetical protein JHK85_044511 [Glycine max]KAG5106986.1 hypothetical protein JHK82_043956 [Glycine max]KAG5117917.1 hypothetical protein JHK84_044030 [Glycine max]